MLEDKIIEKQRRFYVNNSAGCLFAGIAARNPKEFGWQQTVIENDAEIIDQTVNEAIINEKTSTLSLIFPMVTCSQSLAKLVDNLVACQTVYLEQQEVFEGDYCLGFRGKINELQSWISGFGNFDFFPLTRRSPFTEITFRVKPKPEFKFEMKETPKQIIHLANLDLLKAISDTVFKKLWNATFQKTEQTLGHKPNLKSAAKITFSIPKNIWLKTCLSK